MKEIVDPNTNEKYIRLSEEEVKFGFLSQCVEALAEAEQCDYLTMLDKMEAADMTEGYILKHYDTLHTQSMETILEYLREYLNNH
ncbi:MAG: DUF3791 domain-containing protein [Muribaculaceae bacterium]|nr:DUF3791 domain-containing protein [Muribaculaceae bacterium]